MKKMISLLLIGTLIFSAAALAEEKTETMAGIITLIDELGFLLDNDTLGEVRVTLDEKTVMESEEEIQKGDYVTVFFSGAMTKSILPQIYATKVMCVKMEGKVTAISEDGANIMIETKEQGSVIVYLPKDAIHIPAVGSYVRLYFNGIMTMSLPPQINAQLINSYASVIGEIREITDAYIVIKQEGDDMLRVNYSNEETLILGELSEGEQVQVLYDGKTTRSIPAQIFGQRINVLSQDITP